MKTENLTEKQNNLINTFIKKSENILNFINKKYFYKNNKISKQELQNHIKKIEKKQKKFYNYINKKKKLIRIEIFINILNEIKNKEIYFNLKRFNNLLKNFEIKTTNKKIQINKKFTKKEIKNFYKLYIKHFILDFQIELEYFK